ncbi:MAG: hypothetical protein PHI59_00655 [Candidatus Omnitrophica bacterium]|nr:hypothetical protein [Candidatus Omnitrophota bacterium]
MANNAKETIKVGDVRVCIWQNSARVEGKDVLIPNITFHRLYMGESGKPQFTSGFRMKDLPMLEKAIKEAYEYLRKSNGSTIV